MIPLIILVLITGALRGFIQGMVMSKGSDVTSKLAIKDGVRNHMAFSQYHAIDAIFLVCVVSLSIALHNIYSNSAVNIFLYLFTGSMIIMWRSSELFYSLSRWGKLEAYEHVVILDIISFRIEGLKHIAWTFGWIVVGIWLLIAGGF